MEFKRFMQLFIIYALSIVIPLLLIEKLQLTSFTGKLAILVIIGYLVLAIPLTIMTLRKSQK
ncbi:hypothetical protein [Vagococcus salmoninarum]|uniref:Uncharacterized protein n=1 Tax=Vagococcus salmoninarum TaxID=2739 RepID=A0A429ZCM2_9ENTE|nr:hypothetical protein [Vagococcus salmoninarum]MBE9389637.1 hypothetical protein [Vagococcus salmoninarum]RST91434.1 hypothetical protein CBF35_14115 [Vagococcus salmoninarum]